MSVCLLLAHSFRFDLCWVSNPQLKTLLELLDRLNPTIEELTTAVKKEAETMPEVQRLMTHPGAGFPVSPSISWVAEWEWWVLQV